MITLEQIQVFSQQIAKKFQPDRIILFGSYAYGQPTEDSDVDLLVILPFEELPVYKAIEIRRDVKPPFPLDLMARTSEQIQQRLDMGNFLFKTLLTKVASSMRPITQEWINKAEGDFALTPGDRICYSGDRNYYIGYNRG